MKKTITTLVAIILYVASYSQVELYGRYTKGQTIEPDFNIYGRKKISKSMNFTYFGMIEKNYAQGYVGVSYTPKTWLSFGLSAGIEQNPALYRLAGNVWTGKGKNSLLILWEKGDGTKNYWYKATATHKFSEKFSLGIRTWRFHGEGVIATYTHVKSGISLWAVPAYDFESKTQKLIAGISVKM